MTHSSSAQNHTSNISTVKRGRKHRAFISSKGETIPGLAHDTDGKWRIVSTGQKFREADETIAILKAKRLLMEASGNGTVSINIPMDGETYTEAVKVMISEAKRTGEPITMAASTTEASGLFQTVPEAILWPWLRKLLLESPDYVAIKTGIPQLRGLATLDIPKPSIRLSELLDMFKAQNGSLDDSKHRGATIFQGLIDFTGATTVNELSTERLLAYKASIEANESYKSGETKSWLYGRVKAVVSFGLRIGLDAVQLKACQERMKVLWTRTKKRTRKPMPISKANFHALYQTADEHWKTVLLVSLNCCLHMGECYALQWDSMDLDRGVHAQIRAKTAEDEVPRAAVLWPETIAALKRIKRTGSPLIFPSPYGGMYNRTSRGNEFGKLRTRAQVDASIVFDHIRDGAYTAAANAKGVEEKYARVVAGHISEGMQARYVLANPDCTKEACQAIYKVYGPFEGVTTAKAE